MRSSRLPAALLALVLAACGGGRSGAEEATKVAVFAASSLTDAFTELGRDFESATAGVSMSFNFLSSSDLAAQIEQGAPADVFASADRANVQRIVDAGLNEGDPQVFARNRLEIVVAEGNPRHVGDLSDLEDPGLVLSLCNEECPAGRYALEAFDNADVDVEADSLESEVKAVVARVETGEADAGVVYATDVRAARRDVDGVVVPSADNVIATYPLVLLDGSPPDAQAFVDFVLSQVGQRTLRGYGFLPT